MSGFLPSRTFTKVLFLLAIGMSCGGYTRVWSQTVPTQAEDGEAVLGEVLVTATRRETKLSDTPISMSVVSADEIEHQRLVNFGDVELAIPNFVFTQVTRQETYFSIRGTGVDNDTPGSDPGVSVFIDGVPRTGVHDNNPDLFDLQSIEVLRGPQGTLFGRNTTGGAVIIHTVAPSFEPTFKGQLTYGSDNLVEVNGLATGPVIPEVLAGKISFLVHHRDGYVDNVVQNRENGREKSGSMRAQLLWTPVEGLKVVFAGDYLRDTSESRLGLLEGTYVPSLFPTLQFGPDVTNAAYTPQASNTTVGAATTVEWTTDVGTLTSISGYRSVQGSISYAALGDPATQLLSDQQVKDRQYSEEIHFASPTGRPLTWLGGLFYLHLNRLDADLYTVFPVPGTALSYLYPPGASSLHNQEVLTTSRAVFGEATYSILENLDLTAGARYSSEKRSGHSEITPFEASGPYEATWSAFTPKGSISFKPAPNVLTYVTVAKGFTSGGFDGSATTDTGLRTPFNPETVINYEIGAKITALERTLTVNSALFLANYKDLQRTAFDSSPTVNAYRTTNAGKARVKGLEMELTYLPVRWMTLGVTYAYTDAKYIEYNVPQDNGSVISYSGNTMPQAPKQQVHVSGEVTAPWSVADGQFFAGADYTYRSEMQFVDANDTPQYILNKTRFNGLVNAHIGWRSMNDRMTVNVFAKNISDKRPLVSFPDFTPYFATPQELGDPANHIYLSRYNPGRMIGVTLTVRY
jgi:iron complex outermembrane receptor protein